MYAFMTIMAFLIYFRRWNCICKIIFNLYIRKALSMLLVIHFLLGYSYLSMVESDVKRVIFLQISYNIYYICMLTKAHVEPNMIQGSEHFTFIIDYNPWGIMNINWSYLLVVLPMKYVLKSWKDSSR